MSTRFDHFNQKSTMVELLLIDVQFSELVRTDGELATNHILSEQFQFVTFEFVDLVLEDNFTVSVVFVDTASALTPRLGLAVARAVGAFRAAL